MTLAEEVRETTENTEEETSTSPAAQKPTSAGSARPAPRQESAGRRPPRQQRRPYGRRKVCMFCAEHIDDIDYKNVDLLYRFISNRAKIMSRRKTGTCAKHQRKLAVAIKRARHLALLPFTDEQLRG